VNLAELLFDSEESRANVRRVNGVVAGLVTDNQDPEGRARVRVSFPWLAEQAHSDWAKIAVPMAGKDRGTYFLPEVGDEVLVAFEHGDIHHPYVLGSLWNAEDTPPCSNTDGKNNLRVIRSRSGHQLTFCDNNEGGQEKVELRTKSGHVITLDDSTGAERIEIKDKSGGNVLIMDSTRGEVSLQSQTRLTIKSAQIEIEADASMKLSCGAVLEIKGGIIKLG
jgi:uncharacterized protein involved in type VI secretion and phage assembly